jgi:thymidine kinase
MNAGKSTSLLQSSYNYRERGMNTLVMTASIDNRYGIGKVSSRIGLQSDAQVFGANDDLVTLIETAHTDNKLHCVLVDESQFLSKDQVKQLTHVVDNLDIPVLCYGLRSDFQGELFTGSQYLLAWADKLVELKTICHCGRKANMVVRLDGEGKPMREGEQVEIGGNESYESVCRKHFREFLWD